MLKPLLDHCRPAPFGDGKKTRYDRLVRDALQLKAAERGGFSIKGFDPESGGILAEIQRELVPHDPKPITAELDSVNVYTGGGHFAPHKDTPRGNDMLGTLVVCLPSRFSHGQLLVSHRGVIQEFDWASAISKQDSPNQLHWAAFFGDVNHQIKSVWSGARVTLSYLLRRGGNGAPMRPNKKVNLAPQIQEAWQTLLADKEFLPKGGTLGYPCCHLYHQDARFQTEQSPIDRGTATRLKGRDHLVAATALEAGLEVDFVPYMFENCADETWLLERFPTSKEKSRLRCRMDPSDLEEAFPILASSEDGGFDVTWMDEPPSSDETMRQSADDHDPQLPAAALVHSCEYSATGYFGNEGGEVDLYTYAALHVRIPKLGKGLRAMAKKSTTPTAKVKRSTGKGKGKAKRE
ncbi:MAG TPA: hypothetical protein VN641_11235 [Urbifossiella sp.]|nr:hypothetical protein [Urbifossiella sp.]